MILTENHVELRVARQSGSHVGPVNKMALSPLRVSGKMYNAPNVPEVVGFTRCQYTPLAPANTQGARDPLVRD